MSDRGGRCYDGPVATVVQPTLVSLTDSAAAKIRDLMSEEPEGEAAVLRIAVQGGGCSGFQYALGFDRGPQDGDNEDRKSTRLNSSHLVISYAVFCLKKKKTKRTTQSSTFISVYCRLLPRRRRTTRLL